MATIIKPETLQQPSGTAFRHVAYDLTDMAAEADDYLGSVRREAAKIVDQARREAAAVRQDAEAAGRRAAEEAIERILDEKVAKQMTTLLPALHGAIEQVREAKQGWLRHWESAAVELATAIAGRLVRGELARRPELSTEWVREALELAAGAAEIAIHLNPADQQALGRQAAQLATAIHPAATTRVTPDATVGPGECRVTTEFGGVDLRIETQLERVKEELS